MAFATFFQEIAVEVVNYGIYNEGREGKNQYTKERKILWAEHLRNF